MAMIPGCAVTRPNNLLSHDTIPVIARIGFIDRDRVVLCIVQVLLDVNHCTVR